MSYSVERSALPIDAATVPVGPFVLVLVRVGGILFAAWRGHRGREVEVHVGSA